MKIYKYIRRFVLHSPSFFFEKKVTTMVILHLTDAKFIQHKRKRNTFMNTQKRETPIHTKDIWVRDAQTTKLSFIQRSSTLTCCMVHL